MSPLKPGWIFSVLRCSPIGTENISWRALAESGFDPLARSTQFMLTEEAHHLFVGETGIGRIIERTTQMMKQDPNEDVKKLGGIPLDMIQRHINTWFSVSLDLFGGEDSSNAASFFALGLKGRYKETDESRYPDHRALEGCYTVDAFTARGPSHQTGNPPASSHELGSQRRLRRRLRACSEKMEQHHQEGGNRLYDHLALRSL